MQKAEEEQRAKARDSYTNFSQLPAEQKKTVREKWEAYSSLPSDEKQRIRETGKSSRLLAPPSAPEVPTGEHSPLPADTATSESPRR